MASTPRPAPLSSELAQRVVDLVAPLINHNINIMDEHGTVIAAVDPSRIGTLHHGAQAAIARNEAVLVTAPDPDSSDRPGANEPLVIDDAVAGVVGVTGDPNLVAPLARLVALTVRLLITQEREYDSLTRRNTEARDVLAALASGTTTATEAADRLRRAGLSPPWRLSIHAHTEAGSDHRSQAPEDAVAVAARINTDERHRAAILHGALWTLSGSGAGAPSRLDDLDARLAQIHDIRDAQDLLSFAEELRALGRYARLIAKPGDTTWSSRIAVAAARLPHHSLQRMAASIAALTEEQRRTIRVWAAHPSPAATAEALFIHRNTLLQRVERIRRLSGHDLRIPDDATAARLAVAAADALGE